MLATKPLLPQLQLFLPLKLLPLREDRVHALGRLEVAKVLLAQPRLGAHLHLLAVEGAQDGEHRLARAHVRRDEEAHRLVAHQLPHLQAGDRRLRKPALGELDLGVGRAAPEQRHEAGRDGELRRGGLERERR